MKKQFLYLVLLGILCSVGNVWGDGTDLSTSTFYQTYASSEKDVSTLISDASFPSYITTDIANTQNGKITAIPAISSPHNFSGLNTDTKYYRLKTGSKKITITNVANLKKVYFYGNGSSSTRSITTAVTKVSGSGSVFTVANITGIPNSNATIAEYSTVDFSSQTGYDNRTYYTYVFTFSGDVSLWGIYLEAGAAPSSDPSISASDASITATESGVEVTEGIEVTGTNLTGSTLTAVLSPAVDGLSVSLGSNSITEGSISTTATLHYTQTTNARGNTTLTLSDGTTSKSVKITYNASIITSSARIFSLNDEKGDAEVVADNATVTPGETLVMSNSSGRIKLTPASGMKFKDGDRIVIRGRVGTTEDKKKPFGIDIYDSNDTKKGSIVYGENVWSGDGELEVSGTLSLSSDQVFIKIARNGGTTTTLTSCEITRVISDPFPLTITTAGWASMYLDFPAKVPTGVTAYYASAVTNSAVTLSPISAGQVIPANTGVVVSGAAGNYDFAYSAEEPVSVVTNYFKGCLVATAVEASTKYVLSPESTPGDCVFGLYTGTTLGAYKAYMDATDRPAGAPDRIQFIIEGENNATNIENIESTDKAVKFIENGRILILRDGIAYDALGRIVK